MPIAGRSELLAVVAVAVASLLCGVLLVNADEDEVLDKASLVEFYKKGVFVLESVPLKRCVAADRSNLVLEDCERLTRRSLWAWMSRHRLYNLGTSACLGLNLTDATQPLGMFECDTPLRTVFWRCNGPSLYGASQMKLAVMGRLVVASKKSYHAWRRLGTTAEGPCSAPYEDVHTLLGNGQGMPCAFPFKYNNRWYSECTSEGREDNHPWCATTPRYDQDERWGFCPVQDSSCETFWESNQELRACYQFNLYTIVTWSQARASCRAQRGDLLSLTSLAEHRYIRERLSDVGVMVWIGLNHLTEGRGWQWSDGAPLALVNFTTGVSGSPLQDNRPCGVYNSAGAWQSLTCESALPYICKKTPNISRRAEPLENWQYHHTVCPDGWTPHNSFCYRVLPVEEAGSWEESSQACISCGAHLTSLHSLSHVELLLSLLGNLSEPSPQVWIGLKTETSHAVFWSDGSPVTLTQWAQYQPPQNISHHGPLCGRVDRKDANWELAWCKERLPAVCRKKGKTDPDDLISPGNQDCPEGWSRHGNACYLVTEHLQNFHDAMSGYYCIDNLLTIDNRFEQAFVNSLLSEMGANSSRDYWVALVDSEKSGEFYWTLNNGTQRPLTYSNWNKHQPVSPGGCVVMSGGTALGQWEVKDCISHKALSVCKHRIPGYHADALPSVHDYHYDHINSSAPCPPGWESRLGFLHCYKVFHDEKVLMKRSWVEADFFCQALGADLAAFHHYEEQVFVKRLLSTMFEGTEGRWFWVGLNKRDPDEHGSWKWSDHSPVVSLFFEDKNEEDEQRNCAVYSHLTNTLLPQPCDAKHEWICQLYRGQELKKPYWYTEQSEPWVFYHGAEYLLARQLFNWEAVSLACQMMGAQLLSIHSKEELRFIQQRMAKLSVGATDWWIGLSINLPTEEVSWSDKTELDLHNWAEVGSYSGPVNHKLCVSMSSASGKWSVGECSGLHGYVCKRRTVSVLETHREPHYIGSCPEDWLYFGHKCFLLHLPDGPEDGKSWPDADSICSSFQGSLVAIEDQIQQAYITMLLQGSAVGVWIGQRIDDTERWTNGRPVGYTNWSPKNSPAEDEWLSAAVAAGEPLCTVLSNHHNLHLAGKWYDDKCSETGYGFVCQKPQDPSKPPTHTYHHPIPDNVDYKSRSYKVLPGNMSWYKAQQACMDSGSELASITDAYHQAFLTVLVNRLAAPHWIGLYSQDDGMNYQWSDGSDTVYAHWDANEDEEDFVTGECVYIDVSGGWRRADCERPLPGALCHVPPPRSNAFTIYEVVCPSTWVKFGNGCYNFEPAVQRLTLEEARDHCRQKVNTSDVLSIQSETENRFVLEQLWSSGFPHQTLWLGMFFNTDTEALAWLDGSPLNYTNWHFRAPERSALSADTCLSVRVLDGMWHLSPCTQRLGFVCKTRPGLHRGVIPAAVLVAVLIFCMVAAILWLLYRRSASRFGRLPPLVGGAYYRQTDSQATESDGNVLITDLEGAAGE
ncbi:unnamed protein product [Lota lota]